MPDKAHIDFETYSDAGYKHDLASGKWIALNRNGGSGLPAVGAAAYAEHSSTELLSLAYEIENTPLRIWVPGCPLPRDLFEHIARGGLVYAHNSLFEFFVWHYACHTRMGWPALPLAQTRDTMAQCYSHSLPGKLADAGKVMCLPEQKTPGGRTLLNKFSKPRNPTKTNPALRLMPADDPANAEKLYAYNLQDVRAERCLSEAIPELTGYEQQVWELDQRVNVRGVQIDRGGLDKLRGFVAEIDLTYCAELYSLTGGAVSRPTEHQKLAAWLSDYGCEMPNMQIGTVRDTLKRGGLSPEARRALEIRAILGSASIRKLDAINLRISSDGRLRGLFAYQGADRTGRAAGRGPQPQNIPGGGPDAVKCSVCGVYQSGRAMCFHCNGPTTPTAWTTEAVDSVVGLSSFNDLARAYPDPVAAIKGCLRGLFVAAPGHDLICSDFSAIEAVVTAELAGEAWRQEVFRTHGRIYEMCASQISGIPLEEILGHKARTGEHHPLRKPLGKIPELASGFGGWIGAWKRFGAEKYFDSDAEIKASILKWRDRSPAIVEMWGGQIRPGGIYENYGFEGAAVSAILNPGQCFESHGIGFGVRDGNLRVRLLSGRLLTYHQVELHQTKHRFYGLPCWAISYWGVSGDENDRSKKWKQLWTYGGKLTENIVQATARDLMMHSMLALDAAGYPIVLHVHDEAVAEVPQDFGSVEDFERIMSGVPHWAAGWPVKAAGGWRGRRYRKD